MVDWDYAPANHGYETLPYTGPVLTHGALKSYWGPCPPRGPHRYEMTFDALNAEQTLVLGSGSAMRYYPNKSSAKASEAVKPVSYAEFEKMMALMEGADITYDRIGYYTRPMKVYKKNGDWIIKQTVKNEISKIEYEGGNQISFNGFPYNWPQNGTWTFSQNGNQCQIDHVGGGRVMRWICGSESAVTLMEPQKPVTVEKVVTTEEQSREKVVVEENLQTPEVKPVEPPQMDISSKVKEQSVNDVMTSNKQTQPEPVKNKPSTLNLSQYKMGVESYNVEKRAEQMGCQRSSIAYFTGKRGLIENYYVECLNQPSMTFRCDLGNCVLR